MWDISDELNAKQSYLQIAWETYEPDYNNQVRTQCTALLEALRRCQLTPDKAKELLDMFKVFKRIHKA